MSQFRGQIQEVINRTTVVSLALAQRFNAFLPVYDGGVDFILHHEGDGRTLKVQLKSRWNIERKYVGRDISIAFLHQGDWHNLESYLLAYIEGCGLGADSKSPLFRTIGRGTDQLTRTALSQSNAYAMVRRRANAAGIGTKIGNHTRSGRPVSRAISRMAAHWKKRRPWRTIARPGPLSSMAAAPTM